MKSLLCLLLIALGMNSCGRCHDEICSPGALTIEVKGFDTSELRNIVMYRYDTAGFYVNRLETIPCREIIVDTVNGIPHTLLSLAMWGDYDWEIIFPAIQRSVHIYDLTYERQTYRVCSGDDMPSLCTSPITSYNQDGTIRYTVAPQPDHSESIQIDR